MIERLEGFPDDVVALSAVGQVTKGDYERVLIPAVEEKLKIYSKIRFYYELGPRFTGLEPGAAWEDAKESLRHFSKWEKMAVVTDTEWVKRVMAGLSAIASGELRVFPNAEAEAARTWVISKTAGVGSL